MCEYETVTFGHKAINALAFCDEEEEEEEEEGREGEKEEEGRQQYNRKTNVQ